ncbi:MAG: roadblock/LC7 domain-containing protein [Methylococcales bacterium]|nr:roadblock/LC7 domain-containing protein [Methylococcales bacterium]
MIIAIIIGIFAAALLLLAGYIFGAKQGDSVRENLQGQLAFSQSEVKQFNASTEKKMDTLIEQSGNMSGSLNRVVEPLSEWKSQIGKLDDVVKEMQGSVDKNSKMAFDLTNLKTNAKDRGNLTRLMDEIVEKAGFEVVLLSDDNGLPITANSDITDLDRLAAISAFVLIFSDRFIRDGATVPLSLLTHDNESREMLCRIFYVGEQRFVLTAIAVDLLLTSTALDPVLVKVMDILSSSTKNYKGE